MTRSFNLNDYKMIAEWFKKRGMQAPDPRLLPPTGIIEEEMAAGFLIKTDCRFGILDFFVSNPDAPKLDRQKALDLIATQLIFDARVAGLKFIKCDTKFDNIKHMADKQKMTYFGEVSTFAKEL